jgi:hypothetical protein
VQASRKPSGISEQEITLSGALLIFAIREQQDENGYLAERITRKNLW